MASSVYWKFKSQKDESRVTFDGPTISVSDLKREIIVQNNLVSSASDFDLLIFEPSTEQEYKDDNHQIARSTSVLAKRLPAARPGKGKAAQYVLGINPNDIPRPDSTSAANRPTPKPQEPQQIVVPEGTSADEAAGIAAMFQASQEVWDETQEKMAQATPVYTNRGGFRGGKPFNQGTRGGPDGARQQDSRPVPPGYICYRCAKKGHWIHDCPTNDDREWDNRPRVKRTTGIPRSFLKTVEQTTDAPLGQGVMVTPDGGFVVAQPDSVAWQKQRARPKALTSAEIYQNPAPAAHSSFACPICDRLTKNAVRTPCCKQTFCEECIQTYLLEHDFVCRCGKKIASFDRLEVDDKRREKVGELVRTMIEESRKESAKQEAEESQQPTPSASSTPTPAPISDKPTSSTPPATTSTGPDLADLQAQMAQLSQMLTNPGLPQQAKQQAQRQAAKIGAEIQKLMSAADGGMQMGMAGNMGMGGNGMGMGGGGGMGMGGGGMGMNGMGMGGPMGGMGMNGMGMPGNMNMGMNGMGMGMGMPGMNNIGGMGMPGMRMPPNMGMGMNNMGMPMGGMGMMGMGGPMGMNMNMGMMPGPNPMMNPHQNWTNPYANQQPLGNESAYQRLPVHNRRKKRDRPSDFVEVGGEQSKVPRYWE
ncbi:unnamed protein product [Rhizoctonia solani]|uniref:Uncharacterized protein n=1 Tax=Rhizoctonia solani TaxID=456999 RepID=A0A8H3ARW5_9AGAM|nr:unnamed protein product [Rhizoctonia solani]